MKQLIVHMKANQGGLVVKNNNRNTCCPPTRLTANEPKQGQPHKLLPHVSTKYFWSHQKFAYDSAACNNKAPTHQDTAIFCNKHNGRTYWCT